MGVKRLNPTTLFKEVMGDLVYREFSEYDLSIYWARHEVSPNNVSSPALFILNHETINIAPCEDSVLISFVFLLQNSDLPDFREDERLLEDMALKLKNLIKTQSEYTLNFKRKGPVISQMVKSKEENQKDNELYGTFIQLDYDLIYDSDEEIDNCIG